MQVLATLQDLRKNGASTTLKAEAADQSGLLGAVRALADQIRQQLSSSPAVLKELSAASLKPSSALFQALRYYQEGMDLVRQGNHSDAAKRFTLATDEDPQFALVYSKLAQANAALGYDAEAARFSSRAMNLSATLPPQEKYLIEATHARIRNDTAAALTAYENLAKVSPNDATILFDLGGLDENPRRVSERSGRLRAGAPARPEIGVHAPRQRTHPLTTAEAAGGARVPLTKAQGLAIQLSYEVSQANVLHALGVAYSQLDKPTEAQKSLPRFTRDQAPSWPEVRHLRQPQRVGAGAIRLGHQAEAETSSPKPWR